MNLTNRLPIQITQAIKAGDRLRLQSLRLLLAAIKNEQIAVGRPLTDEQEITIVERLIKQRREAAEIYKQAARSDQARQENDEITILEQFLPEQLSKQAVLEIIKQALTQTQARSTKDLGKVMSLVMPQLKGRANGQLVSQLVAQLLKP